MKKFSILCLTILTVLVLAACGSNISNADSSEDEPVKVKIGVNGADGAQWPLLKEKAAKEGIEIELIEFADYTLPNNALAHGEIDINAFQHIAFLGQYVKESGEDILPIGSTMFAPMGLYSEKLEDISELKEGDKIAIPDDPSNQARALRLLESTDLIKLADDFGMFGDPSKITENQLNLEIIPMTAQQTPRVLPDVAGSIINNGVAGQAGLSPADDPILKEDEDNDDIHPYVNIIATSAENKENKTYKRVVELYQEADIEQAIKDDTNGGSILVKLTQAQLDAAFEELKK
ncbi:methionine ABC transporter substrate-binding protein [Alkalihalobacillus alcalophilus ATCC 27647 = CGMCC 1.3604]|uniref:Lipoprotein n=1 Tax=Alkalihalobacillus alcalophilus ATCC 27647 = CGMCC 1.3604 TaxID=1218173 RepID=A0A094WKX6_ALKAL|nr:MetQ/NlpA family ABC transporter substrate-binding protein [Alkalihalobacillus alcalophilus]KGA97516.1 methionine ABC transporter substrate-binding protein [Alkalihalobacillus alcalophilus ATCC 27647 = CGMCC 1.3604]MED1560767.1 MetQ/NlpA family ABC transporter substrate-binding protein [Alkalihalobacillus alcalophilus]THG91916.1 methionine ABC transporter substrate-binding protein [Alkalihalobacillus alcalophilus ATCC 27647 = CGMCC 1.3604]